MIDATKLITTLLEKKGYEKIDLHVLEQLKDQFPDTPLFATSYKKKLKANNKKEVLSNNDVNNIQIDKRLKKVVLEKDHTKETPPKEEDFISETLANLHYDQGNLSEALDMYEKLYLKYPEKRVFFAGRIKEIKEKS